MNDQPLADYPAPAEEDPYVDLGGERMRLFAAAFAVNFDMDEACEAAAVNRRKGFKWLKNRFVKTQISSIVKEREGKLGRTGDDVLARLWELADVASAREPTAVLATDDMGLRYTDYLRVHNLPAAKGLLELLAKHHQLLTDNVNVQHQFPTFHLNTAPLPGAVIDHPPQTEAAFLGPENDDQDDEDMSWLYE